MMTYFFNNRQLKSNRQKKFLEIFHEDYLVEDTLLPYLFETCFNCELLSCVKASLDTISAFFDL